MHRDRSSAKQSRIRVAAWVTAWVAYWLAFTLFGSDWDGSAPLLIGFLLAGAVAFVVGRPQVLWLAPVLFLYLAISGTLGASEGTTGAGGAATVTGLFAALYSAGAILVGLAVRGAVSLIRHRRARHQGQVRDSTSSGT